LREKAAVERSLLGAAVDEPSVWFFAADDAANPSVVVERCPVRGTKIEVALNAEAVEKVGDRLGFGCSFDDLQIADEARADVAFGLVNLDRAAGAGEDDGGGKAGRPRTGNADRAMILHQSRYGTAPLRREFRGRLSDIDDYRPNGA
jgi:hypothetical protein